MYIFDLYLFENRKKKKNCKKSVDFQNYMKFMIDLMKIKIKIKIKISLFFFY